MSQASSAILRGAVALNDNSGNGAEVNGESMLEIRGAHVQANGNGGIGVIAGSGQLALFGLASSAGSTLTANNNGFAGALRRGIKADGICRLHDRRVQQRHRSLSRQWFTDRRRQWKQWVVAREQRRRNAGPGGLRGFVPGRTITVQNNASTGLLGDGAGEMALVSDPPGTIGHPEQWHRPWTSSLEPARSFRGSPSVPSFATRLC